MCICVCMYVYIYVYMCMYVCMYIYMSLRWDVFTEFNSVQKSTVQTKGYAFLLLHFKVSVLLFSRKHILHILCRIIYSLDIYLRFGTLSYMWN